MTGRPASATSYWAACIFKVFCPTPAAPCLFLLSLQSELDRCWSAVNLLVMCMVICQTDSGKGLEPGAGRQQQGSSGGCCSPVLLTVRSRTGDWQFSPTALRIPLSTARRPERTAIALCFFCLLSDVPAASFMEMEGPRGCSVLAPVNTALGALPNAEQYQVSFRGCAGVSSVLSPALALALVACRTARTSRLGWAAFVLYAGTSTGQRGSGKREIVQPDAGRKGSIV